MQRDERATFGDVSEQGFFFLLGNLFDVRVDEQCVVFLEFVGGERLGDVLGIDNVDSASSENGFDLIGSIRGLTVPLIAEEKHLQSCGLIVRLGSSRGKKAQSGKENEEGCLCERIPSKVVHFHRCGVLEEL